MPFSPAIVVPKAPSSLILPQARLAFATQNTYNYCRLTYASLEIMSLRPTATAGTALGWGGAGGEGWGRGARWAWVGREGEGLGE